MCFDSLKRLFSRKKQIPKNVEPIIPEHRKEKMEVEKRQTEIKELKKEHKKIKEDKIVADTIADEIKDSKLIDLKIEKNNETCLFKISGVYNIGPTQMISGFVETGIIKKGMKAIANENQMTVIEVRKNTEKTDYLVAGQEGTILIKSKKNPLIRQDDYLEFN
ncbi:MAG: hypothetical protein PHP82_02785 [Candidatus ainarchaeum sp.]|nr:hypothetical protein [Candidatus ainarchaeum sp.]